MVVGNPFTTGGPVSSRDKNKIYVRRAADDSLLENCLEGNYCVVLTSRQMGKTSLLHHAIDELKGHGVVAAFVDLSRIGTGSVTADEWYQSFLSILIDTLGLNLDIEEWWRQHNSYTYNIRFSRFITDVLLQEVTQRIIIFVDEIEMTTLLEERVSDSFFAAIRSLLIARGTNDAFDRISFVLVGMAEVSDLIRQHDITTYNIGKRIELANFTADEIAPLVKTIPSSVLIDDLCDWIIGWTGGQPFLTQLLCVRLNNSKSPVASKKMVDSLVEQLIAENDQDLYSMHFTTVVRSLTSTARTSAVLMLGIYSLILDNEIVRDTEESIAVRSLRLFGLVRSEQGILKVSNNIYVRLFNQSWIETQLRTLRGYAGLHQTVVSAIEHLSQYSAFSLPPKEKAYKQEQLTKPDVAEARSSQTLKIQSKELSRETESKKDEVSPAAEKRETSETRHANSQISPDKQPASSPNKQVLESEYSEDDMFFSEEEFEEKETEEKAFAIQKLQEILSHLWERLIRPITTIALRSALRMVLAVAPLVGVALFTAVVLSLYINSLPSLLIIGGILLGVLFVASTVVSIRSERSLVEERLGRFLDEDVVDTHRMGIPRYVIFLGLISVMAAGIIVFGFYTYSVYWFIIGALVLLITLVVMLISIIARRKKPLVEWVRGGNHEQYRIFTRLSDELVQAGISLKPLEYLLFILLVGSLTSFMFGFLFGFNTLALSFGGVLGVLAPRIYLVRQKDLHGLGVESQLIGALGLIQSGLRAGYSINQAIESVSKELHPPISEEFRLVVTEMQAGLPMERALENMLSRVPSLNLNLIVTSMIIQREAGGLLSEILNNILNRIRSYNQAILESKRLGLPTFDFVYTFSIVFAGIYFLIFPEILGAIENNVVVQPGLLNVLIAWSFVILLMGMIKNRKERLLDQIHRVKQVSYKIWINLLLLSLAYLMGVPKLLIVCFIILYFSQYTPLWYIIAGVWAIVVSPHLSFGGVITLSFQDDRFKNLLLVIDELSRYTPNNVQFPFQLIKINPLVGWSLLCVFIVAVSALIVLADLRFINDGDGTDAVIAEYLQRGDFLTYSELDRARPLSERLFFPILRKLGDFTVRFTPQFVLADFQLKLEQAGNPFFNSPTFFLLSRFVLAIVFGAIAIAYIVISPPADPSKNLLIIGGAAFAGSFIPAQMLQNRIVRRQSEVRNSFVFVLDILTLCTEAGLGFDAAMRQVVDKWDGEVSSIFDRTLQEIQRGKPRQEAMHEMARRIGIPELTHFIDTIVQSDNLGTSLAGLLRIQGDEMFLAQQEHVASELGKLDFYSKSLFIILFSLGIVLWIFMPILLQI